MNRLALGGLIALLLAPASARTSPQRPDGGGRDVSVALFSTRALRSVTLDAARPSAWVSNCARCARKPLQAPLHLAAGAEIFAGGMLRVTDDATGDARTAAGLWHLRSSPDGTLDVILTMPSERYVAAVLNGEAAASEPAASPQALAIVARTFALNGSHFAAIKGHLPAELCDSTECQAMRLGPVSAEIQAAVDATAGETLWFGARRAEVYFSQSCGGLTEDAGSVWPKLAGTPYLRSHPDSFCVRRDSTAWHAEVPIQDFAAIASAQGWHLPTQWSAAHVLTRSAAHRALKIEFADPAGHRAVIAAPALRLAIGRALGWNRIRSDWYDLGLRNGLLVFDGRGHGHGVGLCQLGATEMATEGKATRSILNFYFPGTSLRITPADAGWISTPVAATTVRSSAPLTPEIRATIDEAWARARQRFAPRTPISPSLTFATSTELFRQLAVEPGWALAGTRGQTIVLQPASILAARHVRLADLLLHEFLHVLVEAEASDRAPLWLREGLVEVLAGEPAEAAPHLSPSQIDQALAHAATWVQSQQAHQAAAAQVRLCLNRYGASAVRSWLVSGPPATLR
jgi:stage II sporulation protein D